MADKEPIALGVHVHVDTFKRTSNPPPAGGVPELIVKLSVQGEPRRARITLSRAGKLAHVGQTDSAGNGFITGVAPGLYSCVVQREGRKVSKRTSVMLAGQPDTGCTLVIGEGG